MALDSLSANPFLGTSRNPFNYEKVEQVSRDIQTAWLTLEQITNQLNLFNDESQDAYLTSIEVATRMAIEDYLGMAICSVQYKVYYGSTTTNSSGNQMCLDLPEVSQDFKNSAGVTINSVGYWNGNTPPVFVTLANTSYFYDPTGNKIVVSGIPSEVNQVMTSPIVATYTTNANPVAQYPVIKQAGLLLLTHLYNNRSNTIQGGLSEIPYGVAQLLRPYKPLVM
ncbi:gp6 domain containing protein [uncultured Caudovirales phage]|uniref:Gp6 domain containing protein n=1 Tax=uncultured Caudovirales phage TaxID=2100421 RepID=A0A6J5KHF5_9CAUD|nr:gp6 domain containing protein [uncultured Caudovirales phage]